jgi:hypothetical protein
MTISFARHQFPPAIIRHAVWLYLRFTLSYRDVEDLLAERGLDVSYETVRRWVLKFGALSHQAFLLPSAYLGGEAGLNKFKRLVNRPRASKQPFLARCDGVDDARAASGSMKGRAKMVVVRATV